MYQGQNIGTRLLEYIEPVLKRQLSYCLPYDYLIGFYGKIGFKKVDELELPVILLERLQKYLNQNKPVVAMKL
ncbi:hypothetical protein BGC07_13920 [Piscirickettsia litoralis]|uniref:N-acetyltransferase domain-containing protein n=2 Tax=Piscirickettsia litoralis TaxID=1891921 RepID=A0ABX3A5A2_9GAMM|nr:hypothetical protein BGC07_13920 [Piscirickettsia litoralis]